MPRGELSDIVMIVARLEWYCTVTFITDCLPVHNGIAGHWTEGANADLWKHQWHLVEKTEITLEARWIKAHLDRKPWLIDTMGFTKEYVCGSFAVDALAGRASKKAASPMHEVQHCITYTGVVQRIQMGTCHTGV